MTLRTKPPAFFVSAPHPCSYLPDKTATTLVIDPEVQVSSKVYSTMLEAGFRRSGSLVYRPHCEDCRQCISVRIAAGEFQPSRSQRRIWKRNRDLEVRYIERAGFDPEHFALYCRYQASRHPGSSMDNGNAKDYEDFLINSSLDTAMVEMRLAGRLLGLATIDRVTDGVSAIYTFFDPEASRRSPGIYMIMWLIHFACLQELQWVYLGYWIADCRKMSYKNQFKPAQGFYPQRGILHGVWRPL